MVVVVQGRRIVVLVVSFLSECSASFVMLEVVSVCSGACVIVCYELVLFILSC